MKTKIHRKRSSIGRHRAQCGVVLNEAAILKTFAEIVEEDRVNLCKKCFDPIRVDFEFRIRGENKRTPLQTKMAKKKELDDDIYSAQVRLDALKEEVARLGAEIYDLLQRGEK